MTPNKFTTMLHRRTNRITRVLIYALLEWILISLLLLNSLFSLLILKLARYFGLKPPCILCSRLDASKNRASLFSSSSSSSSSSYTDIICEQHAAEISRIGYCSNHRKLVESQSLCHDCSPSSSSSSLSSSVPEQDAALFKWMREIGIVSDGPDPDSSDDVKRCSCCDNIITTRRFSLPFVDSVAIAKSLPLDQETGDFVSDNKFNYQALDDDDVVDDDDDDDNEEEEKEEEEGEKEPLLNAINGDNDNTKNKEEIVVSDQNLCADMLPQHLEFYIDHDDYRLIPVALINSVKAQKEEVCDDFELVFEADELVSSCEAVSKKLPSIQEDEQDEASQIDQVFEKSSSYEDSQSPVSKEQEREKGSEVSSQVQIEERSLTILQDEKLKDSEISSQNQEDEDKIEEISETLQSCNEVKNGIENVEISQVQEEIPEAESLSILERQHEKEEEKEDEIIKPNEIISAPSESLEEATVSQLRSDERNEEETDRILTIQEEESPAPCKLETDESVTVTDTVVVCEVSTSSTHLASLDDHDDKQTESEVVEAEVTEESLKVNVVSCHNEVEEEKVPDTPTSVESLNNLNKKLLALGRRESATEESIDGSIVSEIEGGDGGAVVEKLKSELQAERKTLRALYKELEEERNAAAIAANQTMAMINRLQEEKASMQMEALQYQRMMEEQSEYDQEALQMMNELMVKREKEKQELEKELEVYRKKVVDYEEREKMRMLYRRRDESMRSRNSSASCSYGEESDGLSVDLNHEAKDQEEDSTNSPHSHDENGHQDTPPTDAVLGLQDSLASFEEERYAILEQLKALEEKLFTLAEEEEEHIHNMKPFEQFCTEEINGKECDDADGDENGFSHVNGKHQQERKINGSMQKRLLPLFDATELESSDGELHGKELDGLIDGEALNKCPVTKFELEKKRLAIEEEIDHVYERLHALEADREFLKHCIGSLRKGDKGLDLLQEILQHLRDLKNVELQVMKNMDLCASV